MHGRRDDLAGLALIRWAPLGADARPVRLVLVHGGFHGAWYWRVWGRELAKLGWSCLAVDLPGHGGSRCAPERYVRLGVADYAAAVTALADAVAPCVLVGHSLGGLVVQVAAEHADPLAQVLLCTSPLASVSGSTIAAVPDGAPVAPPDPVEMRRRWYRLPVHPRFRGYRAVHRRLSPESPTALNDRYRNRVDAPPARCPTLVVGTTTDPRHEHGAVDRRTAAYHHRPTLLLHRRHGHALCAEVGTEHTARVVAGWLADHVPDRVTTRSDPYSRRHR
ncbi:MAG TPA: alpha/beta fold hydrolase [Micromonosporaceae bacterium]